MRFLYSYYVISQDTQFPGSSKDFDLEIYTSTSMASALDRIGIK